MQNKLSCLPVSLFQSFFDRAMDVPTWSAHAAKMGLDYIDINIRCLLNMPKGAVETVAKQLSVPVMMVTTYSDFTNPDADGLQAAVDQAKKDIETTAALKAKYLRLTAGQAYPGQDEDAVIDRVYRCFEACVPAAEEAGIGLLLENHSKPGAWQYADFNFHLERMLRLWENLQALPVGINYDTANAFALHNWKALLEACRGRIETVHINDLTSVQPLQFSCVGDGIVPIREQLDVLWAMGFCGPICIEEAGMQGLEGISRSVAHVRQLLDN